MWKFFKIFAIIMFVMVIVGATVAGIFFAAYPLRFRTDIREASARFDVPSDLVAAVIRAESNFRTGVKSRAGAVGLMQLMPRTAEYVAGMIDMSGEEFENLRNPGVNITLGVAYLAHLIEMFGDVRTALFAYNAGQGNVRKWLCRPEFSERISIEDKEGEIVEKAVLRRSPFPESNAYVARVMRARQAYRGRV